MAYTDDEDSFMEGMEKLVDILNEAAEGIENLAESFDPSDEELARFSSPSLVNALDGMTGIIEGATEKIMVMIAEENDVDDPSFDEDDDMVEDLDEDDET